MMKVQFSTVFVAMTLLCLARPYAQTGGSVVPDVVYGHKDGLALTFDVFKPASKPNGAGVLYIESGGWRSRWQPAERSRARFDKLLSNGFTVFVVRHGSAPRYNAHEAYEDVRRAVRVVRLQATSFGVDANRLGVHGGSAGGHLSLMLGLASDAGDPTAEDAVLRVSSQVAAVVAYYPPVDLRPQGQSGSDFPAATKESYFFSNGLAVPRATERWSALNLEASVAAGISPITHVSSDDPPTMLVHGDVDTIVDLNASQMIHAAFEKQNVQTQLVVIEGGKHGFPDRGNRVRAMDALVGWFTTHLVH
jgi:acetyl esterase/lipase